MIYMHFDYTIKLAYKEQLGPKNDPYIQVFAISMLNYIQNINLGIEISF